MQSDYVSTLIGLWKLWTQNEVGINFKPTRDDDNGGQLMRVVTQDDCRVMASSTSPTTTLLDGQSSLLGTQNWATKNANFSYHVQLVFNYQCRLLRLLLLNIYRRTNSGRRRVFGRRWLAKGCTVLSLIWRKGWVRVKVRLKAKWNAIGILFCTSDFRLKPLLIILVFLL